MEIDSAKANSNRALAALVLSTLTLIMCVGLFVFTR